MRKGKIDYKIGVYLILGGFLGFFTMYAVDNTEISGLLKWVSSVEVGIVYGLLITVVILLVITGLLLIQLMKMNKQEFTGEEEDAVEIIKYKRSSDYSLLVSINLVISLLAFSFSLMIDSVRMNAILSIGSAVIMIIAVIGSLTPFWLVKKLNPNCHMPSVFEKDAAKRLIKVMDEGEKHVTFQGLYKAYNVFMSLMFIGILLSTLYSNISGQSQVFSIALMAIVLLISNVAYYSTIRKNY